MQNSIEVYSFRDLRAWDRRFKGLKVEGSQSLKIFQGVRLFLGLKFT
jgi:hypothetical protein